VKDEQIMSRYAKAASEPSVLRAKRLLGSQPKSDNGKDDSDSKFW